MSELLWQKPGVEVDPRIQAFLAGDDVLLDREFIQDDIAASAAHARGLARIGILTNDECDALCRELSVLSDDLKSSAFVLDGRYEDGHSAIESRLVERLGDVGRKIHTGRSRNDQILVATRLWLKRQLGEVQALCREVAEVCLQRAEAEAIPMPGYTHLQRAVVSSTAMWWAGFAEAFLRGGVANFIGTWWPVSDSAAAAFAAALYRDLAKGESIGDALGAARGAVRALPSADWANYLHYGSYDFTLKAPQG